jgi:endonuclease YncB( thermonuclease family)
MMFMRRMLIALSLLSLLPTPSIAVNALEINEVASVTQVIDGDTFRTQNDRVRLADIRAPETTTEPGYSIARFALSNLVGGRTVYLDTDQKTGRDTYGRLIAVVYVKVNSTHYINVNKALLVQGVAAEYDYTSNEFNPSDWTYYVRYADSPSQLSVGTQVPQGGTASMGLIYLSLGLSLLSLVTSVILILTRKRSN